MLDFSDKPYRFFPPKPNAYIIRLAKKFNRRFVLPGRKHRISEIRLRHADRILPIIQSKQRILFLPNHSTHSDPQMMLEVQRRMLCNAATMAAYDVFLRGRFQAWFMQRIGCFSVDREGSDSQSMKCAVETLIQGDRALTIFPEGNVALMNDRVMPFLGGAAFIAMRAQKKLGPEKPIYAIPISMKFSYLTDCRDRILTEISNLEQQLGIQSGSTDDASSKSARERMRAIGIQILTRNLRQRGYLPPDISSELDELLQNSAIQIISKLEEKIEIPADDALAPMERIRRIRSAIHQVRIDESQQLDHRVAATWADEAILAVRILNYAGDYLSESPTVDRHGETLEKLREDLADKIVFPIAARRATVQFGEPINLADSLGQKNSRQVLKELTGKFEQAVQQGIDEINADADTPGGGLMEN